MPLVCGVDFETSGLDPVKDRIVEVGAVLYDWNTGTPLILQSDLVCAGVTIPQELTEIHGITTEMLEMWGRNEITTFERLRALMDESDYVMAHFGAEFDQRFCRETFSRLNIDWPKILWLDSSIDIVFSPRITTRNLSYLAAEHGFLNPFCHRAVFDVLTMLRVASEYPLEMIVSRAQEPTIYVQALVDFKNNQKAKDFRFQWNSDRKMWWKSLKESDYKAEMPGYQFEHTLLLTRPE